jgi:tetraacyldisaccharide 4'-kinase
LVLSRLADHFRQVVSGRRGGLFAACQRALLGLVEFPYTAVVRRRNRHYDRPGRSQRVAAPVISVGNLTLGGTGKTPFVAWLARRLLERGVRVAIVSRGYGATSGQLNDEARELALELPEVPHLQNPDRVAASREAIERHGTQLIVLDDGFQHRRLARDLDIVLVDALEPFGFGHVFPRGTLREPLAGFARAQIVVLSRADMIREEERGVIERQVRALAPDATWVEAIHQPRRLRALDGTCETLERLAGRPVVAFCGIGNPPALAETLKRLHYGLIGLRAFADHHAFSAADLKELFIWADAEQATLVCTVKDLVKIDPAWLAGRPLWAVEIGLCVTAGEQALLEHLAGHVPAPA